MKVSPNFHDYEFVPKVIYNNERLKPIWFIRPEIISLAEFYREWFDAPVIVNDWFWGGYFHNRGFRTPNTRVGALYSQHKLGAAFDCNIKGVEPDFIRREILDHEDEFMAAGLTTLEDGAYARTWVHSDIRPTGLNRILIVKP